MADGDYLVAGDDAHRAQRQLQRRGAVGHRAGVGRADGGGELVLEGRYLRPLAHPARAQHTPHGLGFGFPEGGASQRQERTQRRARMTHGRFILTQPTQETHGFRHGMPSTHVMR